MPGIYDEEVVYQLWLDYLTLRDLADEIKSIADAYPEKRSLNVDFSDVFRTNGELAEIILDDPDMAIRVGESSLQSLLDPDQKVAINLRIRNLFASDRILIRNLRASNLTKFISIEGIVRKATEVRPKLLIGVFSCTSCGFKQEIIQDTFSFTEPLECPKDDGGCGKRAGSTTFKFIIHESLFIDAQKIEIQEYPEGLRGGDQPQRLSIFIEDDLCGGVSPGDRLTVSGTLKAKQRRERQNKGVVFDLYMKGNSIEKKDQALDDTELTEEEIMEVKDLSRKPNIFDKVVRSIAPTIFGLREIKESLALQLFGGVPKLYPDGSKGRGDVHILIVGDPGTAKSQLLTYMSKLSPRGIFTSGKSSSAAGLTAAVVKDDFGEGRYTLEAGVMVLADMGLACVDELDKMSDNDRSAMHEAMEQQTISIAKAGIQATLQSRCSVLGAGNPKSGRFRLGHRKHEQIDLPPPLRSRFDLIFTLTDEPNPQKDRELAEAVVDRHWLGELESLSKTGDKTLQRMEESGAGMRKKARPEIEPQRLRNFVSYAKQTCFPVLTKDAMEEIIDYYVELREKNSDFSGEGDTSVPMTARQLEALVRMAEASAKIRLRKEVLRQDAKLATALMDYSLRQVAMDDKGIIDIDGAFGSGFKNQRGKIFEIVTIIKELGKEGKASKDNIVKMAEERNIERGELEDYLRKLKKEGTIYEPRPGQYQAL